MSRSPFKTAIKVEQLSKKSGVSIKQEEEVKVEPFNDGMASIEVSSSKALAI